MRERTGMWLPAVALLFAVAPAGAGNYWRHLLVMALLNIALAVSWNLLLASGQVSLGHAAFFGLGAYVAALVHARVPVPAAIALGGAAALVAALAVGAVCLRMRGIYFAIATLALAEALRVAATMLEGITAGPAGITVASPLAGAPLYAYYLAFALAVGAVGLAWVVRRSRLQIAFDALRQDQLAADSLGIDPTRAKLAAFALSSCVAGMAGGFYAHYITFVVPDTVFGVHVSLEAQLMAILGGVHTLAGPALGAIALTLLQEVLSAHFAQTNQLLYGTLLVTLILVAPRGLLGLVAGRHAVPAPVR